MSIRLRRFAPSIRSVVAAMAAIPVLTLGVITYESLQHSAGQRAVATELESMSDDVVTLIALQSELTIELYWAGAHAAIRTSGLANGVLAEQLLGFDSAETFASAGAVVDERLASGLDRPLADIDLVRAAIEEGRTITTNGGLSGEQVSLPYYDAVDVLAIDIEARLAEIDQASTRVTNDAAVQRAAADLALAAELRDDMADTASHFFALRFPEQSTLDDAGWRLTDAFVRHEDAAERFVANVTNGRQLHHEVHADPAVTEFLAAVSETVSILTDLDGLVPPTADNPIAEFDMFRQSIAAIERHVDLVDATALALDRTTQTVVEQADADRDRAVWRAVIMALAALLLVAIATRWIVRPLRSIADRAERILDGDLASDDNASGLREIRDAEAALNQAAHNIQIAERQATALAEADLDAEILSSPGSGRLDTALRSAFERLRDSIAEREEYRDRLRHEAEHDALTGLPNRPAILWRLERSLANAGATGQQVAVLFIDIDKFKRINDQQGHAAGDRVLQAVARRLVGAVRPTDHVGRLAGDEFVVVIDNVRSDAHAIDIARAIRTAVSVPFEIGATRLAPIVSVGVSVGTGGVDADEMLRDADLAVYRAKTAASDGVELCDSGLRDELVHRTDVERRLLVALEADELELHYQPIVDAATGTVNAYEALLRWQGDGGLPPGEFIPIAERSDLIIEVDRWVVDRAVAQLAIWSDDPLFIGTAVSVNISARHISTTHLAKTVLDALARHSVDPERLVIEITESALLDDVDHAAHELVRLRECGIRVALDDFGTGHTSLSHLRELPVDILKLDREFVVAAEADGDRPLAKLIVEAGHLVGAVVVAEGVETVEQADLMRVLGADEIQGFLFGRPIAPSELVGLARLAGTATLAPTGD